MTTKIYKIQLFVNKLLFSAALNVPIISVPITPPPHAINMMRDKDIFGENID